MHPRAAELIATLDLRPHPEGGYYREAYRSLRRVTSDDERGARAALTTIYFLLHEGAHSRWHRVRSDEVWHFYEGGALELLELDENGDDLTRHCLGPVRGALESPVHTVTAGRWQCARPLDRYTLVGCTVAPGFEYADFQMLADDAERAARVRAAWPEVAGLI